MSLFLHLRETLADAVSASANYNIAVNDIVKPPKREMGDFAWAAFGAAKALGKNPTEVAKEIAAELSRASLKLVGRVEATGPYVNFFLDTAALARELFDEIARTGERFGCVGKNTGEKILFEYSGLNTHKEVHIGHVRNHALGYALVQLWGSQGHTVVPVNFTNDFGVHVAKVVWALQKFYNSTVPTRDGMNRMEALADIYVEATAKLEELGEEGKQEISRVLLAIEEDSSSPEHLLWKETREWSLEGFREVYAENGLHFDHWFFESDVKPAGKKKVMDLLEKGILKRSEGAIIADLEDEGLGVALFLKSDGTGLYATTDIALIDAKLALYPDVDESIVLTDLRQEQHFKQIYAVAHHAGVTKKLGHIGYDLVALPDGLMSSRKGTIVRYRDLRDVLIARASEEVRVRHADWTEEKVTDTARAIAFAAMKFTMVSVSSHQQIVFDMNTALSFTGMSAVYLQYTLARMKSITRKAGEGTHAIEDEIASTPIEREILLHLLWYPDALATGARENDPSVLTRYLFDLCQLMSTFYESCRVINEDGSTHPWRLTLLTHVSDVLEYGMQKLGLATVEEI